MNISIARWFFIAPVVVHLFWAFALILVGPLMVTPKAALLIMFLGNETWLLTTLITSSVAAIGGLSLLSSNGFYGTLFMLPQQILLLVSAGGCLIAICTGVYADGEVRNQWFIAADQLFYMIFAVAHSIALLEGLRQERVDGRNHSAASASAIAR